MFWNETRSKTEVLSVLYQNMQIKTDSKFFERWVAACNDRGLIFRSIIGDTFIASQEAWYNVHKNDRLKNWSGRYVSEDVFPITHGMAIYDNVVAYYNWKDAEVFGIEIYNQEIADAQRTFFDTLWAKGQPPPLLGT
jgi:hypothetical protein